MAQQNQLYPISITKPLSAAAVLLHHHPHACPHPHPHAPPVPRPWIMPWMWMMAWMMDAPWRGARFRRGALEKAAAAAVGIPLLSTRCYW